VNHKTQKQNDFYEVRGNLFGDCEDYHFPGFHAMWPVRSALLKDWLPRLSGQEIIFPTPDKVVQSSG